MSAAQRYVSLWSQISPLGDRIEVIEQGPIIQLRVNGVWQGEMNRATTQLLPTPYMQQMMLTLYYATNLRRLLVVGLGTGCLPKAFHAFLPHAVLDVVEIDPEIVHVAEQFFEFPPRSDETKTTVRGRVGVHIQDGIEFFKNPPGRYDIVLIDAFSGSELPPELRTAQTMWKIRDAMAPGGVLAVNLSRLDPLAIKDIVTNMGRHIQPPALFDPRNEERHDDLNLVLIAPAEPKLGLIQARRRLIKEHKDLLGMNLDALLNNRIQ